MNIIAIRRSRLLKSITAVLLVAGLVFVASRSSTSSLDKTENSPILIQRDSRVGKAFFSEESLGNFEPADKPAPSGPGEKGKKHLLRPEQKNEASQSVSEYGINMVCSDEISLSRTIRDTRLSECKNWHYPEDLPKVSVVIVFHNEGWSTLLRTVQSVIDRSPPQFLEEVLLVDDFSDKVHLKKKLAEFIKRYNGKVRLIRNKEREGLIRTRTRGAQESRGEVVLFLDAHCEVGPNWLPPLLYPIYLDRTTMTVPLIDGIDSDNFEHRPVYQGNTNFRGIFEWGMLYKENEVPDQEARTRSFNSEPYRAPTHAGGLFAIDRAYFLEIGAYDPGLLVWGGENFELSFKIWQCGGKILWVPCSRVGHIYRAFMPYTFGKLAENKKGSLITINYKRVIEVWFDDKYKEFFYTREPTARYLDMGNITQQLEMKKRLKCKSFDWFMKEIAYDVLDKYPELPPNVQWGELRNSAARQCLDTMGHGPPSLMGISHCHGHGNNQLLRLNSAGQLGVGERCVNADSQGVKLAVCRLGTVDGPWEYDEDSRTMQHVVLQRCLAVHPQTQQLTMLPCDMSNNYHKWTFKHIQPK